jgi:hypothetical protein
MMRNNFVSVLLLHPVGRDRVKEKPMTEVFISFKIPQEIMNYIK